MPPKRDRRSGPAPRRKFTTFAEMLAVIDQNRKSKLAKRG